MDNDEIRTVALDQRELVTLHSFRFTRHSITSHRMPRFYDFKLHEHQFESDMFLFRFGGLLRQLMSKVVMFGNIRRIDDDSISWRYTFDHAIGFVSYTKSNSGENQLTSTMEVVTNHSMDTVVTGYPVRVTH